MKPAFSIRTLKLPLTIIGSDKQLVNAEWRRLNMLLSDARRAMNQYVSFCYISDEFMGLVYKARKAETKEEKTAIKQEFFNKVKEDSLFGRLVQNTGEAIVKADFPELPSCITNPMGNYLWSIYTNDRSGVKTGEKTLRSYKKGAAIGVSKASIKFEADDIGHRVYWKLGRSGEPFTFAIPYGKDRGGYRKQVQAMIDGELDWCEPTIQKRKRDGKLFLNVPIKEPMRDHKLDSSLVVGVDVGLNCLMFAGLSKGSARWLWGGSKELRVYRTQFQERRRRLLKESPGCRAGHGYARRTKAANLVSDKERCYVQNANHTASKGVVDFAIRNRAGTIHMEDLSGIHKNKKNTWLYRNWCYFELQTMIKQKAERAGIRVLFVNPRNTSIICPECGNVDAEQRVEVNKCGECGSVKRDRTKFMCKVCGFKGHSDYVASVNIARVSDGKEKRGVVREQDVVGV